MAKRTAPEVNAGSMADIAFLLLIFFLVTTTIASDIGINRKLPPKIGDIPPVDIRKKELFEISINSKNELLVEEEPMDIGDLKEATIAFLDNNGKGDCEYCKGSRNEDLSSHPSKAVIAVKNSRETNYAAYLAVQNELLAAYYFLRNREANRLYGASFQSLTQRWKDAEEDTPKKLELKQQRDAIKAMYPEKISESELDDK